MDKPIYLGLPLLEINKILKYELWYDCMKPKYGNKVNLCCMDTYRFILNTKTEDVYKDAANDAEERIDASKSTMLKENINR